MLKKGATFEIAYYTGTGSTGMVAECFYEALTTAGCSGHIHHIKDSGNRLGQHDILFLLFPLHGFNAPQGIYDWCENLHPVDGLPAVVISVSGGGEVTSNRAGSVSSMNRLKQKGYETIYEKMFTMPNNFVIPTPEPLAVKLLEVLPDRVNKVVEDVFAGVRYKTPCNWIDRAFSWAGELEKKGARPFGKYFEVTEACVSCGQCVQNCPSGNISLVDGTPVYQRHCHLCLGCLYGCPKHALHMRQFKSILLKEGYDIKALRKKVPLTEPVNIDQLAKGWLWAGVRKYLQE